MADVSSDTVDSGKILSISEEQQLNTSRNEDFEPAKPQNSEISQKEDVSGVVGSTVQVSHLVKDDITPCRDAPTTTSSLQDDTTAVQSLSVTCESQDKTNVSEIIGSQSHMPSQSEVTPIVSMGGLEFTEEANGVPPDGPLISTKSVEDVDYQSSPDKALSQGKEGATAGASRVPEPAMPAYYFVKWITWKEKKTAIITQSENGPCPLIAIMNILLLRWKVKLPPQTEVVTTEELMAHLGECVLSIKPREEVEGMELNFQQNMSDAMAVLPKLSTGLDVNVRFTGVCDFEYTPECIVFDLLDIQLYHGWLVDPQSPEMTSAVGKLSYNQLVEKIIEFKHSADSSRVSEGLIAEQFLESTATQLSYHGLCELNTTARDEELCVFFRNNHFSTMIKHKGHLYLLITDQGFLQENVVWESLHNVEGDGNFCDSDFRLCHASQKTTAVSQPTPQTQQQIQQDYLVAMSLQQEQGEAPGPMSDLELARQLQQEEYQQPQTQPQPSAGQQARGPAAAHPGGQKRREKKDDSDCCIL